MKHDYLFFSDLVDHILATSATPFIICFRFDNCATQNTSKRFLPLAKFISTIPNQLIIYCGVSRHGKGLVDAMNSFGVRIYH